MATFIMSYPGPAWGTAAAAALQEWLHLCDQITRAGGRIFVLDPPEPGKAPGPAPPDLVYASRLGALFPNAPDGPAFLLASGADAGAEHAAPVLERAGLRCLRSPGPFSGQGDVIALSRNRFLLTYRSEEERQGLGQVRALLPTGARVLEFALRQGFRSGADCVSAFTSSGNHSVVLLYADGLEGCTLEAVQSFAGVNIDVIPLSGEDAHAHACSMLCVRGTLILPTGLSSFLRGVLVRHAFHLTELELPELRARGGAPRALVNELPGFVVSDDAPTYALRRDELHRLLRRYAT